MKVRYDELTFDDNDLIQRRRTVSSRRNSKEEDTTTGGTAGGGEGVAAGAAGAGRGGGGRGAGGGEGSLQMDSSLRHLIERMLDKDPKRRATLEGVMSHEWITREGIEPMEPIFHPNLNAKYVSLFSLSPVPMSPVLRSPCLPVSGSPCSPVSLSPCLLYLSQAHCQHTHILRHTR